MSGRRIHRVQECTHGGRHKHGTITAYGADGCRCDPCYLAVSTRDAERRRLKAFGRWQGYVDAEPIRAHVRALMAAGMGREQIARVSGVGDAVIGNLLYGGGAHRGPSVTMRPDNAAAILGTPFRRSPSLGEDATGTRRRLQALMRLGWSRPKLAVFLGLSAPRTEQVACAAKVTPATAAKVAALYDKLWDTLPPRTTHAERQSYSRTVRWATSKGFAPPLAWDDETIDDPAAKPYKAPRRIPASERADLDEIAIGEACYGRKVDLTRVERAEAVRRLTERGYSAKAAAEFLGTSDRLIIRKRAANRASGGGGVAA